MKTNKIVAPQKNEMNPMVALLKWLLSKNKREDVPKNSDAEKLRKKMLEKIIVH